MFTTFMVPLFIFTTTKETFSKISSSLSDKRLLCLCYYIYNKLLFEKKIKKLKKNKKIKVNFFYVFELYFFKFELFYNSFFEIVFFEFFEIFFEISF